MAKEFDYPTYDAGGRVEKYKEGGAWTYWRTPETEDKKCGLYVIGDDNEKISEKNK